MDLQHHWDREFRSDRFKDYYDKEVPPEISTIAEALDEGDNVLDLGCGLGLGPLYLAEKKCNVLAVDFSPHALERLIVEALKRKTSIVTRLQYLEDFVFEESYDTIIAHGSLHFLAKRSWERIIREMQMHTKEGGLNYVVVFTDKVEPPDEMEAVLGDVFKEGELFELYKDWDMVVKEDYVKVHDEGGEKHEHSFEKVLGRK